MAESPRSPLVESQQLRLGNLAADSYTAQRLQHATPEHLYRTSRRLFIGPIPKGWLRSHRKTWVEQSLKRNYGSKVATFTASDTVTQQRRLTGLGEDSSQSTKPSFPRPDDAVEVDTSVEQSRGRKGVTIRRRGDTDQSSEPLDGAVPLSPPQVEGPRDKSPQATSPLIQITQSPSIQPDSNSPVIGSGKTSTSTEDRRVAQVDSHPGRASSTAPLISRGTNTDNARVQSGPRGILSKVKNARPRSREASTQDVSQADMPDPEASQPRRKSHIRFDKDIGQSALLMRARMESTDIRNKVSTALKRRYTDGTILKMENMLVRMDISAQRKIPHNYDENTSQGVVSTTQKKWREYTVVCRQSGKTSEASYVLQVYKSRVIPAAEEARSKKPEYEIPLDNRQSRLNMYSSLDKTLVLWNSSSHGTKIYILQARAASSAVEWLTFLRGLMGFHRPAEISILIPQVGLSLRLEDPFRVMTPDEGTSSGDEEELMASALSMEESVAPMMIKRCLEMLSGSDDWAAIIESWSRGQRIGLAWKRYDRLEWVHGIQEKKMFGTLAMIHTHDLELRPKEHYPITARTKKGKLLDEPPPVEGFLIRLTSKTGKQKSMGRYFFKRLYFATFDHFLIYSRPNNAKPPAPPSPEGLNRGLTSEEVSKTVPIIYSVNPYPVNDNKIKWLENSNAQTIEQHDQDALDETRRKADLLKNCDGFINLCDVVKVRKVHHELDGKEIQVPTEDSEVDSDDEAIDNQEEGQVTSIDDSKTIELLLKNGLVIRLRAYDAQTKKEWKRRLRALVKYWRWRHAEDTQLYHQIRDQNLEQLGVDEEGEAWVGQFATKWELSQTYASGQLYNMCGISCCRTIHMSGPLYSKPRVHGNFTLSHCLLIPGFLLLFESAHRSTSGKVIPHIDHDKNKEIDLSDCYLYTGLLTEGDLLYRNTTFDANSPGHHALPRMWPEDAWDNWDEDVMTCFVLWKPQGKSWFRETGEGKRARLKRVSKLGKKGNRMVFRARSRAERDHWVLAIAAEIERGAAQAEFRITGANDPGADVQAE
ncbi:hypothetical protein BT63DRAFT_440855 [Microthyrium microscopicum]|uniref:PH domain-containing protein n=1 Tax=Microthyrium microscopicum TaxID=703497 RepID=A0A6A6UCC5_9PEZI|nr:hypothetical protein BT63DRAFT_440855 [Microthyrium microscopicum]